MIIIAYVLLAIGLTVIVSTLPGRRSLQPVGRLTFRHVTTARQGLRLPPMHLLLIEDDAEAAAFLAKGLRESGYTVDLAADGRDGLFQATEEKYDLLIVDRQLPHLDGLSIVQLLRRNGDRVPGAGAFCAWLGGRPHRRPARRR